MTSYCWHCIWLPRAGVADKYLDTESALHCISAYAQFCHVVQMFCKCMSGVVTSLTDMQISIHTVVVHCTTNQLICTVYSTNLTCEWEQCSLEMLLVLQACWQHYQRGLIREGVPTHIKPTPPHYMYTTRMSQPAEWSSHVAMWGGHIACLMHNPQHLWLHCTKIRTSHHHCAQQS